MNIEMPAMPTLRGDKYDVDRMADWRDACARVAARAAAEEWRKTPEGQAANAATNAWFADWSNRQTRG